MKTVYVLRYVDGVDLKDRTHHLLHVHDREDS